MDSSLSKSHLHRNHWSGGTRQVRTPCDAVLTNEIVERVQLDDEGDDP